MKITAIRRRKGPGERLNIHLDGDLILSISEEAARGAGLRPGGELDETDVRALRNADDGVRAREVALRLLGARPRTRADLRRRLIGKDLGPERVDACLDRLAAAGLVDDEAYARGFVRERLANRPRGPGLLIAELRSRGVESGLAEEVVRAAFEENPDAQVEAARLALRKCRPARNGTPAAERRRLAAFLSRRGFSGSVIATVLRERAGTPGATDSLPSSG